MRLPWLEKYIVAELLKASADNIEKSNITTLALEKLYKNRYLNENWDYFTNRVIGVLNDAITETRVAKQWTHKI